MSSQENNNPESSSGSNSKDAMFEPKPKPKMIRVLTVLAYVLSVSMAAILLSIYYIFMWDGRPHLGARTSNNMEVNYTDRSVEPIFSKYVSHHIALYMYNLSKQEFPNNLTRDESLADGMKMDNENRTRYDYEEFNVTEKQESSTELHTEPRNIKELQQQITAIESEEMTISTTIPTTSQESSVTWPDDYEFERSSILFKKIGLGYDY